MHGIGLEEDVRTWFQDALNEHANGKRSALKFPKSSVPSHQIEIAIQR
jgi:hypothetical protein